MTFFRRFFAASIEKTLDRDRVRSYDLEHKENTCIKIVRMDRAKYSSHYFGRIIAEIEVRVVGFLNGKPTRMGFYEQKH
ncbi:MAG: hypothetical protein AABY84_01545 [Candidatus Firestonebacteria bacterium]